MAGYALWAAIRTVKARIGTWVGFRQVRDAGFDVTESEWATHIGQARVALSARADEATRPLNRRPVAGETTAYSTRHASGFFQQLDIWVRDRETGLIEARPYTLKTSTLRSRQSVIAEGLRRYQQAVDLNPDEYPEDILGASYVGTFELIPGG